MTTEAMSRTWKASLTLDPTSDIAVRIPARMAQVISATWGEWYFGCTRPSPAGRALVSPATNGIRDDPANQAEVAPPIERPIRTATGATIHTMPALAALEPTACMIPWMTLRSPTGTIIRTAAVTRV